MSTTGRLAQAPAARHEHVGLGDDWLVYAAAPGSFPVSEMIAPGVVLGPRGAGIHLHTQSGLHVDGLSLLHAAGVHSAGDGDAIVVLYLDPLTEEGVMVQARAHGHDGVVCWDGGDETGGTLLDICASGALTPAMLTGWVDELRRRLLAGLPRAGSPDARMRTIARVLAQHPEGRPDVQALARAHGISADHLRQTFRRVAGMSLSRYQMWRRVCAMVDNACRTQHRPSWSGAQDAVHAAGFYDMPHGARALRRYFGMTPRHAVGRNIRFVDCRVADQGSALGLSSSP